MIRQIQRVRSIEILLVEDNPGDVRLTQEAFKSAEADVTLQVVRRGEDALRYLHEEVRPNLVLLDLNLPGMSGIEVLKQIKGRESVAVPVIVLTSSDDIHDINQAYGAWANAYITKPSDMGEYTDLARTVSEFWVQRAILPPTEH